MAGISRGNSKVSLSWNAALSGVMFLSTLWQAQASQLLTQQGVDKCEVLFPYRKSKDSFSMSPFPSVKVHTRALKKSVSQESLAQSWNEARTGLLRFQEKYADKQRLLLDMASSLVSRTHLHLDGGPQSGKTSISHDFAKVVLQSYLKNQAAPEKALWIHQFNKMNSESTVLGPYITDAFEKGQMKRLREGSLSDDQKLIAIFDQIGQANSFVLMPLFQVLANRSIFDGTENISLGLMSAIGISNESFAQMLARSGVYRPTMEALADRFQAHAFTPHRHASTEDAIQYRKKVKAFQESGKELLPMDLITLQQNLMPKVRISPKAVDGMVHLIQILDESFTPKSDQREADIRKALQDRKLETPLPYAPANQFTNRGIGDLVRMIKGSFLIEQLLEGVPFDQIRYTIELEDLHLMRFGSITMSPSDFVKKKKNLQISSLPLTMVSFGFSFGDITETPVVHTMYDGRNRKLTVMFSTTSTVKDPSQQADLQVEMILDFHHNQIENIQWKKLGSDSEHDDGSEFIFSFQDPNLSEKEQDTSKRKFLEDLKLHFMTAEIPLPSSNKPPEESSTMIFDDRLQKLQDIPHLSSEERQRLQDLSMEHQTFLDTVNTIKLNMADSSQLIPRQSPKANFQTPVVPSKDLVKYLREHPQKEDRQNLAVHAIHQSYIEWNKAHFESKQTLLHQFVSLMGYDSFITGGPGGGKTTTPSTLIDQALEYENAVLQSQGRPASSKKYMTQVHRLLMPGSITGYANTKSESSKDLKNFDSSLANPNVRRVLLDEVSNGNSGYLGALGQVFERHIYDGQAKELNIESVMVTTNMSVAEFTSDPNFTPDEQLQRQRLLSKIPLMILVPHKLFKEESLSAYIEARDQGKASFSSTYLPMIELKDLVHKVTLSENAEDMMMEVAMTYQQRIHNELVKNILTEHRQDPVAHPYVYKPAHGDSHGEIHKAEEVMKAYFLMDQIVRGVPYSHLRLQMGLSDLRFLIYALGTASEYSVDVQHTNQGKLEFQPNLDLMMKASQSPRYNLRFRKMYDWVIQEVEIFTQIMNELLPKYTETHR